MSVEASNSQAEIEDRIAREQRFHDERFAHDTARAPARKFYALDCGAKQSYRRALLQSCRGKRILEYGCGPGGNAIELAQAGAAVTAIDISPVAIESARSRAGALSTRVSYEVMNAEAMSFPDGSFDVICGSGILHHLDLNRAFQEIRRTLRPEGFAIFLEPLAHNPLINLYRRLTPKMRSQDEHPLRMEDLQLARRYFATFHAEFYNLFTLLAGAAPTAMRSSLLTPLAATDRLLFKTIPFARRYAWMTVLTLSV